MTDLGNRLRAQAFDLANSHTLEELAELVSTNAPDIRGKWSAHAKVPWSLIYAIRIKMMQEPSHD